MENQRVTLSRGRSFSIHPQVLRSEVDSGLLDDGLVTHLEYHGILEDPKKIQTRLQEILGLYKKDLGRWILWDQDSQQYILSAQGKTLEVRIHIPGRPGKSLMEPDPSALDGPAVFLVSIFARNP